MVYNWPWRSGQIDVGFPFWVILEDSGLGQKGELKLIGYFYEL